MSTNLETHQLNIFGDIYQGIVASCAVNGIVQPIGTLKNLLQVGKINSIRNLTSVRGLYNGYWAISGAEAITFSVAYFTNGFFPNQENSLFSSLLAGLVSSPFTAVGEGLMANRQVNQSSYSQIIWRACRLNGLAFTALREIPFTASVFYITPMLERNIYRRCEMTGENLSVQIFSGVAVGAFTGALTTPVDLVKTLVQTANDPLSVSSAIRNINQGGWKNFFRGGAMRAFYIGTAVMTMNMVNHEISHVMPSAFQKTSR